MTDFGFGVPTRLLNKPGDRYILDLLQMHTTKLGVYEQWPNLNRIGLGRFISDLLTKASPAIQQFTQWHHDFIDHTIASNSDTARGILASVIQAGEGKNIKNGHNRAQMLAEGSFITFTASDGNGKTLSGVQHYLAHYPRVYNKLVDELRSKFPRGQVIKWGPELTSCKYLSACINEAWRLLPPACGVHWRECEQPGTFIGSGEIPVGCDVGMSLFTIFRSEKFFRNPSEYWPERWIKGVLPAAEYSMSKKMFTPFSLGSRSCAGSHVAMMIASISIAHLMVNYDFRLADTAVSERDKRETPRAGTHESITSKQLKFESHFTLPFWEQGPVLQFKKRA